MRSFTIAVLTLALASTAIAEDKKPTANAAAVKPAATAPGAATAAPTPPKADAGKALNAIGLSIARSLEPYEFSPADVDKILGGLREGLSGKPPQQKMDEAAMTNLRNYMTARVAELSEKQKKLGEEYVEKQSKVKGAVKTASGAIVIPIKEGTGATPTATDKVKVNYVGTLVNGKKFDASADHGGPSEFNLGGGVIPCWTEAIQKMKVGGKAKIICPSATAYGTGGQQGIPPNSALTFEVELLEATKAPPPPPAQPAPAPVAPKQVK